MSSGKTANYELSQWTKSDRILMEDFNSDNVKIDAALKTTEDAIPIRRLMSITTQAAAAQVDLDLSGIDITQYRELEINLRVPDGATMNACYLRCNGLSTGYMGSSGNATYIASAYLANDSSRVAYSGFLLWTGGKELMGAGVSGCWPTGQGYFSGSIGGFYGLWNTPPGELYALNLVASSGTLPVETEIKLYGVRE